MLKPIRKAVFPVAGLGTRFLPATKANPKEMLPIVDKPLIQYAVEEAAAAGITQMIFVTSGSKRAIIDHFDTNHELEHLLAARGKDELLEIVRSVLPPHVHCVYVRQPSPNGLGGAVLCAREVVGNEPFAVLLADDLIDASEDGSVMQQMLKVYEKNPGNIIGVESILPELSERYGIVAVEPIGDHIGRINQIVEKPPANKAPSNLAVAGRYILQPEIFELLANGRPGAGDEIQLTDAIAQLLATQPCYAFEFSGQRYDCGSKLGYIEATVTYAMKHPEIGKEFKTYLHKLLQEKDWKEG
ncbi:MAG: UTP--glucose-1-phosphate uridylyltransferase GalU [Gammaproteobacteria bacterium]